MVPFMQKVSFVIQDREMGLGGTQTHVREEEEHVYPPFITVALTASVTLQNTIYMEEFKSFR